MCLVIDGSMSVGGFEFTSVTFFSNLVLVGLLRLQFGRANIWLWNSHLRPQHLRVHTSFQRLIQILGNVVVGLAVFSLKFHLNVGKEPARPATLRRLVPSMLSEIIHLGPCCISTTCMKQHTHFFYQDVQL